MNIKIKKLFNNTVVPTKREEDACYDVVAISRTITPMYIEYGLGFATEFDKSIVGEVFPRSSISNYDLILANNVPQIDSGYRGEWKCRFKAVLPTEVVMDFTTNEHSMKYKDWKPKIYEVGDKVAQIRFTYLEDTVFIETQELSDSERSEGGFGSTGK